MIDPIALIVLEPNSVVTTLNGDSEAKRVVVQKFGRANDRTVRVLTHDSEVFVQRADIDHIIDLRSDAYWPRQIDFFTT